MDLKRYFRGPFVALLVVIMLFFFVYKYASSSTPYKQANTSRVISMIQAGQVKSAKLIDNQQTIQITPLHGQPLEASWVGNQGTVIAGLLQKEVAAGKLPQGYNVQVPKGSSLLALIIGWLPFLLMILIFVFLLNPIQGGGSRMNSRQVQGQAGQQGHAEDDFRRHSGRRRGYRGTAGDQGIPAEPGEVPGDRREDPEGRAAVRPAGYRQDAARARWRRGRGAVLLDLRIGLRRDVRRRRRLAGT
jgi:hypothetical protein